MIIARPTVTEERWLLLADRYPALRAVVLQSGYCGNWKTSTLPGRVGGVVLALLGVGLLVVVLSPFDSPWIFGGIALVAVAEWLVTRRRVYRSGVEEVVYVCGALGIVIQLLALRRGNNDAAGAASLATAVLLVGWRLLNPVLTTLALAGYSLAIGLVDAHLFGGGMLNTRAAALFCAALALVALVAGARQWRRPSHDFMCDGLVIVMPWLCCAWLMAYGWQYMPRDYVALAMASGFCALWLTIGVQRRSHALLVGAMGSACAAALSLHHLLRWPLYGYLMVVGAVLLVFAFAIERRLRGRTAGITADAVDADGLDLLQFAGAAHLSPVVGHAPAATMQGHGGEFGGGGASGRF